MAALVTGTTVDELLEEPFRNRTLENKITIASEGKPRPLLQMSAVTVSDEEDGIMKTEVFDPAMYDQVPWLTGSGTQQCVYCWPCLLFSSKVYQWKIAILAFLSDAIPLHEKTVEHIQAVVNLKTFLAEHIKIIKVDADDNKFNEMVHRNREVMKMLISAVCNVAVSDKPPRGKNSGRSQIKPESCMKTLNLLRCCNTNSLNHIDNAIQMIKLFPELLTVVVDSVRKCVNISIKKELQMSAYVTLILSEHSTDRTKSQLSVILRYIRKGQVCERFLGFVNILVDKTVDVIHSLISSTVEELGIPNKFVAYSLDGAVLDLSELSILISMLGRKYPNAFFVPCYFHEMQYILKQSLSEYNEFRHFFKMINVMDVFFHKHESDFRTITWNNPYSRFRNLESYTHFPFVENSCGFKKNFVETFESILKNSTKWSADDYIKSFSLLNFFEDFQTRFLSRALGDMFQHIAPLAADLKSCSPEMIFQSRMVVEIINKLKGAVEDFRSYFNATVEEMNNGVESESKRSKVDYSNLQIPCHVLYCTMIKHLILEVKSRFHHLDKLEFCLLIQEHSANSAKEICVSNYYVKLLNAPGLDFNVEQLKSEVTVQQANETIKQKNAYDLLHFFEIANLKNTFKYTQKLVEFTLAMPFMPPEQEEPHSSKFKKIKQFSYSTDSMLAPGDISVLHIESKLLQELKNNVFFFDDVIDKFYEVNKSMKLMYEKSD